LWSGAVLAAPECYQTCPKLFWVFTSGTIYLTKTDMHNLCLILC
jgi:hypothetical protein